MSPSPRLTPARAFVPFFVVSALELVTRLFDLDAIATITKPLLMPALALVVFLEAPTAPRGPRVLLLAGLGFSWLGDVLLMGEGLGFFSAGLSAFLLAHVAYVVLFARAVPGRIRPFSLVYVVAYVAMLFLVGPHLGALFVPVLLYGAILATMAAFATRGDRTLALGGGLFMVSDAILAARKFLDGVEIPFGSFLVMLTYLAAQALITASITRALREGVR